MMNPRPLAPAASLPPSAEANCSCVAPSLLPPRPRLQKKLTAPRVFQNPRTDSAQSSIHHEVPRSEELLILFVMAAIARTRGPGRRAPQHQRGCMQERLAWVKNLCLCIIEFCICSLLDSCPEDRSAAVASLAVSSLV